MVSPLSAGSVYVDVLPDTSRFGGAVRRELTAQTSGLKRQSEQLSKSFMSSFTDIGKSIQSATSHLGIFGKTNSRVAESTIQAQRGVERATEQRERASVELAQAEQRLAQVQSRAASSAQDLALAQLRVRSASLSAAGASSRYDESIKRLGDSSSDTRRSFSSLVPSIGNANASLSLATRSAGLFGGALTLIKWPALIQGANLAAAAISSLSAAAVGAISSLAPLAGLVATIPAGIAAVGSAVGTAALGFFGVGDALTAMSDQATASIPAVGGAGGAAADAGRRAADAGRAVVAAQRGVVDANRAVQDSERSLADAQRQVQYAQESLTDAREDARQTLQDLNDEVQGGALSEEQAKLRVLQARQRLREVQRDETATRLDVRQAILDVRQAEFDLSETREDNRESQQALNEAERAGISGSEQVIDARRGVADANRGVEDAERALADAHRGVADAQRAVTEAQRGVTEALQAGSGATTAASSEATALAEAMAALSPAGRDFVEVLFNMKPKLDELRATAQEGLLPGLGRAIQTLGRELFPLLNRAVGATAKTMGNLAEEGAALVTSGPWKRDFAVLLSGNSRLLRNMGHIAFDLGDAFRHIAIAGQPLAFWLGRVAEKGAQAIADFFEKARRSGNMAAFLDDTREAAKRLFSILGNLGTILVDVLEAGQPLGRWLLRQFDELTEGWANFTGSIKGRNALREWFNNAKPVLRELGKLIGDIAAMFGEMATTKGLPQLIRQLRTRLLPVIADIFETSSGKLIPAIVELTRQFLKLFKIFGTEHGFVVSFIEGLTNILRIVNSLLRSVPGLKNSMASISSLAGIFAAFKFTTFITGFSTVSKLIAGVGGSAATATGKVTLLQRAVAALGGPAAGAAGFAGLGIGSSIAAAMAVGGGVLRGLDILTDKLHAAGGFARFLGDSMRDTLNVLTAGGFSVANKIMDSLFGEERLKLWEDFKRTTIRTWNAVRDKVEGVWRPIRNTIRAGVRLVTRWWKDLGEDLRRITRKAWDFVKDAVEAGIKFVRNIVGTVMATLSGDWDRAWDGIKKVLSTVWDAIKSIVSNAWDVVKRVFGNALDAVRRMWDNGWGRFNDVLHRVWGNIFDFIRKIPGRIIDFFRNLPENLRKVGENAIGAFAAGIRSGDSIIESAIKAALGPLTGGLSNIISFFGDAGAATGDGLGRAAAAAQAAASAGKPGSIGGKAVEWANKAIAAVPGPQYITSTYRSPAANAAAGGSPTSYHLDKDNPAADISGPQDSSGTFIYGDAIAAYLRRFNYRELLWRTSGHYDHVHVADRGGVFKGPGMVQIGNIKETIFQPAEKMSDLPKRDETIAPLLKQLVKILALSRQDKNKEGAGPQGGVTRPIQGNVAVFKNQNKVLNEITNVFEKQQREVLDSGKATKDYSKVIKDANDISVQQKEKIAVVIGGLRQLGGELKASQRETISTHLETGDYKGGLELLHNAIDRVTGKSKDQAGILSKVEERFKQIKAKADAYRQTLNGIPRRKDTEADAKTRDATKKINDYLEKLEEIPGQISTTASVKMGQGTGLSLAKIAPGGKTGSAAAMAGAAMNAVRGTQVITSGYRPGDDGYHGDASNPAQDISGAQQNGVFIYGQSIYNYLIKTFGQNIREMIWAHDRWEDGQHNYWSAGDHFDHVHVADKGGVFRGPGLVRLGDTEETIFQPAEKMSELSNQEITNNKKMEVHLHGDFKNPADYAREFDWYARTRPW